MISESTSEIKVWTEKDLAVFDQLQTPLWIFDFELIGKWWANRSGLILWSSPNNEHMRERGRGAPISEATKIRLAKLREQIESGEVTRDRWTYYPTGLPPFVAEVLFSRIFIADNDGDPPRLAMLAEARLIGEQEMDPFYRRSLEVLRHMGELVSLYKLDGELIMRNPAAIGAFGDNSGLPPGTDSFAQIFVSPTDAGSVRIALEQGSVQGEYEVVTKKGLAWHTIDVRKVLDPVSGAPAILVNHRDITERVHAEHALAESRERLAFQTEQLRRLAASPLRVWKSILALPLIGRIDEQRIRAGLEGIQARAAVEEIKVVLLDLTGAEGVDSDAAQGIRRLIRSLALQGIASRVVGVRATLARTLVGEGIDLGDVPLHASLADALATALRR